MQRALKFMNSGPQANMGSLDHMLAVFFIDCCIHLVRKYPEDAEVLKKLFAKFDQKDGDIQKSWLAMEESSTYIETWDNYYAHDPFYLPFKFFLQQSLKKLQLAAKHLCCQHPPISPAGYQSEFLQKDCIYIKRRGHSFQHGYTVSSIPLQTGY